MMAEALETGDHVKVFLDSKFWKSSGWFEGTVVRVDPYSGYRSFYWVQLEVEVQDLRGGKTTLISVLNPRNIVRIQSGFRF